MGFRQPTRPSHSVCWRTCSARCTAKLQKSTSGWHSARERAAQSESSTIRGAISKTRASIFAGRRFKIHRAHDAAGQQRPLRRPRPRGQRRAALEQEPPRPPEHEGERVVRRAAARVCDAHARASLQRIETTIPHLLLSHGQATVNTYGVNSTTKRAPPYGHGARKASIPKPTSCVIMGHTFCCFPSRTWAWAPSGR